MFPLQKCGWNNALQNWNVLKENNRNACTCIILTHMWMDKTEALESFTFIQYKGWNSIKMKHFHYVKRVFQYIIPIYLKQNISESLVNDKFFKGYYFVPIFNCRNSSSVWIFHRIKPLFSAPLFHELFPWWSHSNIRFLRKEVNT